MQECRFMR